MWHVRNDDDPQAFSELVSRWHRPILGLCIRMTGDRHRGEDLVQETFARLFAHRKTYEPTGKFSTFLWRIAVNLCYDELRKINRRGELSLEESEATSPGSIDLESNDPSPDQSLVDNERARAVRDALLQLPESHRVVLVLRHYEGLKLREIGVILGIPEGTVKSRMFDALGQLSQLLNPLISDVPEAFKPDTAPGTNSISRPPERLLI